MNSDLISRIADEFEALDLSAENERIRELRAEIAKAEEAIAKAETRCSEIARKLIDRRGPDGRQVGDALLANATAREAVDAGERTEDLEAERAALRAGIGDLQQRVREWEIEIDQQRSASFSQAARLAQPLIDAITGEARAAAERIVECYSAVGAIAMGIHAGSISETQLRYAADGVMGNGKLLRWSRKVPVPEEIQALLDRLSDKGPALIVGRFSNVAGP